MGWAEDTKRLREKLGCGLREARDAVEKYGTFDKAWEALKPDAPSETKDPYARAVEDRDRWHAKSSEYKNGLIRIKNSVIFHELPEDIRQYVQDALTAGDKL